MLTLVNEMQGWAVVPTSVKLHYFLEGEDFSLCGRWPSANLNPSEFIDFNHGCADNCKACRSKRQELQHG
jgi:hypothetical protein